MAPKEQTNILTQPKQIELPKSSMFLASRTLPSSPKRSKLIRMSRNSPCRSVCLPNPHYTWPLSRAVNGSFCRPPGSFDDCEAFVVVGQCILVEGSLPITQRWLIIMRLYVSCLRAGGIKITKVMTLGVASSELQLRRYACLKHKTRIQLL
jgi:hypothetical protein